MAGILEAVANSAGLTLYAHVRDSAGQVWNGSSFEAYNASNWGDYDIAMSEDGSSMYYKAGFPSVARGKYRVIIYQQPGGSPAQGDPVVGSYTLAWDGSSEVVFPANFADLAITASTGRTTVGTNADKTGYDLNADQSGVTVGTVDALGTQAKADVNAEALDVVNTDTFAEPTGVPSATVSLASKLGYIFMALRNKLTVTGTAKTFFDDAGNEEWKKTLSDDGTTYTEDEGGAP